MERAPSARYAVRWWLLLPGAASFLLYLPTLSHSFVWDDAIFLLDLPFFREFSGWHEVFLQAFVISPDYFRPLALVTFMAEARVAGAEPFLFHLDNVALHVLNTTLVAYLGYRLYCEAGTAGAAWTREAHRSAAVKVGTCTGLVYGVHPALTESVAFVSSRFDLMAAFFTLLALCADIRLRGKFLRPAGVAAAFFLAALSKEMAIALVLAMPFWHLCREEKLPWARDIQGGRPPGSAVSVYVALAAAGCVYLALRFAGLGHLLSGRKGLSLDVGNALEHVLLVAKSLLQYTILAIWPFTTVSPLHYADLPIPATDAGAWVPLGAVLLLMAALIFWAKRLPESGWLAVAGIVSLAPVVNIIPLQLSGGAFVAERYLCFPLSLFVLAVGQLLGRMLRAAPNKQAAPAVLTRRVVLALATVWILAGAVTATIVAKHWRDDHTLWSWGVRRAPRSVIPLVNLSLQKINRGEFQAGLDLTRRALKLAPDEPNALDKSGLALLGLERYPEAQTVLERAVLKAPKSAMTWCNLSVALLKQGKIREAELVLRERALRLDPNFPWGHLNLGIVHYLAGRPQQAEESLLLALQLLPAYEQEKARTWLARIRTGGGER